MQIHKYIHFSLVLVSQTEASKNLIKNPTQKLID